MKDVKSLLDQLKEDSTSVALQSRYEGISQQADDIAVRRWTAAQSTELGSQCGDIQSRLSSLTGDIHAAAIQNWLADVASQSQIYIPDNTPNAWQNALAALGQKAEVEKMARDPTLLAGRQEKMKAWVALIPALDSAIRNAPGLPKDAGQPIQDRRRQELWMALPPMNLDDAPPATDALVTTATTKSVWVSELNRLRKISPW